MTRHAPDGYTVAVATSGGIAINPILIKDKIPYNVEKDFTYLYGMAAQPNIWLVNPSLPGQNHGGADRLAEGEPADAVRDIWPRHDAAYLRRDAGGRRGAQDDARHLPRIKPQHPGSD